MSAKPERADSGPDIDAMVKSLRRIESPAVRYFLTMLADAVADELARKRKSERLTAS